LTGGDDGLVYLYSMVSSSMQNNSVIDEMAIDETATPRLIRFFDKHNAPLNDVSFSKDGSYFASGCQNGVLVVYHYDATLEEYVSRKGTLELI
jgi:WD40 repeat protein